MVPKREIEEAQFEKTLYGIFQIILYVIKKVYRKRNYQMKILLGKRYILNHCAFNEK